MTGNFFLYIQFQDFFRLKFHYNIFGKKLLYNENRIFFKCFFCGQAKVSTFLVCSDICMTKKSVKKAYSSSFLLTLHLYAALNPAWWSLQIGDCGLHQEISRNFKGNLDSATWLLRNFTCHHATTPTPASPACAVTCRCGQKSPLDGAMDLLS